MRGLHARGDQARRRASRRWLRTAVLRVGRKAALPTPIHSAATSLHAVIQPAGVHAAGRAPIISILAGNSASSMPAACMPWLAASSFSLVMRRASDWCQGDSNVAGSENACTRAAITLADVELDPQSELLALRRLQDEHFFGRPTAAPRCWPPVRPRSC